MKDTSFESTGPFGGNGGFEWDDGIYTTIRTLIICASSVIESIQIEYDDKGRSKFSNKHGESESGAKYTVELDYPSEYIRLITGRYGTNNHDMVVVLSLKIESNKKEYGPFGDKEEGEGNSFEFPSKGNKIIGFHGGSNSHLISIGAYFLPIPDPIESISIKPFGGFGGSIWDDGKFTAIRKLIICHSSIIGFIEIEYDDKGLSKFSSRRGQTIGTESMVELDYPDEFLISVWGYINSFNSLTIVESIGFESNKRKYGPFGTKKENYFKFPSTNGKIIGFYGRSDRWLDSLGGYYQPISNPGEIVRTKMFGGLGGFEWDDGAYTEVKRLIIYCSSVIESIQIHYDNNQPANVHGRPHSKRYEVELDYPREHLISVSGYIDVNGARTIIQSLIIESNKRTYGPFGMVKETYFQFPSTSGKIIGFQGSAGLYLDAIGAHIEPILDPCQSICISPFGGQGGIDWNDGVHSTIRKIVIYYSDVIESIQIEYDDKGRLHTSNMHGYHRGMPKTVKLDYPNEFLISVSGYVHVDSSPIVVGSLHFETNKRTYGPFGMEKGRFFKFPTIKGKIIGFHGRCSDHIDSIGAYFEPLPDP